MEEFRSWALERYRELKVEILEVGAREASFGI